MGLGAVTAFVCHPAAAQSQEEPRGKKKPTAEERKANLNKLQTARAIKLKEHLALSDQELERVDQALRRFDTQLFEEMEAHRKTRRKLKQAIRRGDSDKELQRLLDQIVAQRRRLDTLRMDQFEAAAKPLSVRQRIELFQFLPQFERKARRHMRKAAKRGRRGH